MQQQAEITKESLLSNLSQNFGLLTDEDYKWFQFLLSSDTSRFRSAEHKSESSLLQRVHEHDSVIHPFLTRAAALPSLPFVTRPQSGSQLLYKRYRFIEEVQYIDGLSQHVRVWPRMVAR